MKRVLCLLLALSLIFGLCACGKKKTKEDAPEEPSAEESVLPGQSGPMEVRITMDNLYQYFEYREYPAAIRSEDGEKITSVQISYGLQLRPEYTAAYPDEKKDTMTVTFEATGVVNHGEYDVNFDTLSYTGSTYDTQSNPVSETLNFWPKGDRTTVWTYGNYSSSYILYLQDFKVVSAQGTVYLLAADPAANG